MLKPYVAEARDASPSELAVFLTSLLLFESTIFLMRSATVSLALLNLMGGLTLPMAICRSVFFRTPFSCIPIQKNNTVSVSVAYKYTRISHQNSSFGTQVHTLRTALRRLPLHHI